MEQAQSVKSLLDLELKSVFGSEISSQIKRGCSEFPLKHPEYGKVSSEANDMFKFPQEWKSFEKQFDEDDFI